MDNKIDYFAFEAVMARAERTNRRVWILCIILIVALIATNAGWIYYESQFVYETTTIEAEQEGEGVNIIGAGDIHYGAESKDN